MIEHTNRVVFLEDDDVAAVKDGCLTLHRVRRVPMAVRRVQLESGVTPLGSAPSDHRAIATLNMVLSDIMKGVHCNCNALAFLLVPFSSSA